jgi:hypothetical protein
VRGQIRVAFRIVGGIDGAALQQLDGAQIAGAQAQIAQVAGAQAQMLRSQAQIAGMTSEGGCRGWCIGELSRDFFGHPSVKRQLLNAKDAHSLTTVLYSFAGLFIAAAVIVCCGLLLCGYWKRERAKGERAKGEHVRGGRDIEDGEQQPMASSLTRIFGAIAGSLTTTASADGNPAPATPAGGGGDSGDRRPDQGHRLATLTGAGVAEHIENLPQPEPQPAQRLAQLRYRYRASTPPRRSEWEPEPEPEPNAEPEPQPAEQSAQLRASTPSQPRASTPPQSKLFVPPRRSVPEPEPESKTEPEPQPAAEQRAQLHASTPPRSEAEPEPERRSRRVVVRPFSTSVALSCVCAVCRI